MSDILRKGRPHRLPVQEAAVITRPPVHPSRHTPIRSFISARVVLIVSSSLSLFFALCTLSFSLLNPPRHLGVFEHVKLSFPARRGLTNLIIWDIVKLMLINVRAFYSTLNGSRGVGIENKAVFQGFSQRCRNLCTLHYRNFYQNEKI